ncbi:MAG: hypothetical protein LBJ14_02935 [Desulfarculales bacterium]|jgi:hypothetical protein|nr:hypothetical protein [Desulfarculales bacterium]
MAYMQAKMMQMLPLPVKEARGLAGFDLKELTMGIMGGSIKYQPTEKMLAYEEMFIRYKTEDAIAWEKFMPAMPLDQLNIFLSKFSANASEEEITARYALFDNYMKISRQHEHELNELKQEIFADFSASHQ